MARFLVKSKECVYKGLFIDCLDFKGVNDNYTEIPVGTHSVNIPSFAVSSHLTL